MGPPASSPIPINLLPSLFGSTVMCFNFPQCALPQQAELECSHGTPLSGVGAGAFRAFKEHSPQSRPLQMCSLLLLLLLSLTSVMCDSVRPHRRQPTRLPRPWDSPGKNTGGGCHFLLQCGKVKSESEVAQQCPTLHDPMACSLPGSSICGIFQAKVLEWGAHCPP